MAFTDKSWIRRSVLVLAAVIGLGLLLGGAILDRASIGILGLGAWLFLAMALTYGVRARLSSLSEGLAGARRDIEVVRNQGATGGRHAQDALRVLRESQLKMHSRVASLNAALASSRSGNAESLSKLGRDLSEQVHLLHEQRRLVEDGHSLVLRVFRESDVVWQGVARRIEESKRSADVAAEALLKNTHEHKHSARELVASLKEVEERCRALDQTHREAVEKLSSDIARQLRPVGELAASRKEIGSALLGVEEGVGGIRTTVAGVLDEVQQHRKSSRSDLNRVKYEMVQEVEALMHLRKLVPLVAPPPLLGGWAMDPAATLKLVQMLLEQRPKLVLECGSGASTVWLAAALKQSGGGKLVSLDHLEAYAQDTTRALHQQGLQDVAQVRLAALEDVEIDGETFSWYARSALEDLHGVELLSVDGPPSAVGRLARYPAVPLVATRLADQAVIVLDDTDRRDEKAALKRWREQYPQIVDVTQLGSRTIACHWTAAGS